MSKPMLIRNENITSLQKDKRLKCYKIHKFKPVTMRILRGKVCDT